MRFVYTASDRSGAQRKGKLVASSSAEARGSLEQLGMKVLELRPADDSGSFPGLGPPEKPAPPDLPKSSGPPSGSFPQPKSSGPPSGSFPRPDLPQSVGPSSRPDQHRSSGSGSLRAVKATTGPPAKATPVKDKPVPPGQSLWARLDWRRLGPVLGGLLMLIVVVGFFLLNQPRKVEVTLKGKISVASSKTRQSVVNPYGNLTLYVYFPDERRLVSAKGVAEPTGKRWKGIKDPNHHFKLDIQPDGKYELKLSFTASRVPQKCTLTINKPGYSSSKKRGLSLQRDGSSLVATATNSSLRLRSRNRKGARR